MEQLEVKSKNSMEAAKLLFANDFYSSVCHTAYYSCFLLAKQRLVDCGMSLLDQDNEIGKKKGRSHVVIIKSVEDLLLKQIGKKSLTKFSRAYKNLKAYRIEADYTEKIIEEIIAVNSIKYAEEVRLELDRLGGN